MLARSGRAAREHIRPTIDRMRPRGLGVRSPPVDVLFLSPNYPPEMQQFTRGLAEVGARVLGVGDTPSQALAPVVKQALADYLVVPSSLDTADVTRRLAGWLRGRSVDRVETNWEPLTLLAAELRERWGLPGMRRDAVLGFRDKVLMRERLRAAGVRVPRAMRIRTVPDAWRAAEQLGFPLVFKPIAGAGGADTWIARDARELEVVLRRTVHVPEASLEELVVGDEHTYETICVDGVPVVEGVTRYHPNVLDARKNEWISPIIMTLRDRAAAPLAAGVAMGRRVLEVLGMGSGFTHMEWFAAPSGEAVFGEVACRSPGACMVDLMNYAGDVDLFREWARAVCGLPVEVDPMPKHHAAIVFKRAHGRGRIAGSRGLDAFRRKHGPHIAREDFLPIGAPRRDWQSTFLSDGHVVVRHPDHDRALAMAQEAAASIQLFAR